MLPAAGVMVTGKVPASPAPSLMTKHWPSTPAGSVIPQGAGDDIRITTMSSFTVMVSDDAVTTRTLRTRPAAVVTVPPK